MNRCHIGGEDGSSAKVDDKARDLACGLCSRVSYP